MLNSADVPPAILALGTAVPPFSAAQSEVGEWMAASFAGRPALQRLIRAIHTLSGIERRHSCTPEYLLPPADSPFAPGQDEANTLSTSGRMAIYTREAPRLGEAAARQALEEYADQTDSTYAAVAASITHLVVVSCTGFFAPGLDFVLAARLGLPADVRRTLIGFMGCAAAFNGLRTATDTVGAHDDARVLVVCVELCSLHGQPSTARDSLVSASLFADGAAAALVGRPAAHDSDYFQLDEFITRMQPATEDQMIWQIGDRGFDLRLSPQVPEHIAQVAPAALADLFGEHTPGFWAVHPGGRAIVDRLADLFALPADALAPTYAVLRDYGNMSSPTILFVLRRLRDHLRETGTSASRAARAPGVAMAFGPGLVVEMARLRYVPARDAAVAGAPVAALDTARP